MKTLVFRGTPVTCARDAEDLLGAVGQDATFNKVRIGSNMLVNAAIHGLISANWLRILPHIALETRVRFVGHSLGACQALVAPAFVPRSVHPSVFAFAPFQCANAAFWSATYGGREVPRSFGRTKDIAPGWNHLDIHTALCGPITHLLGEGKTEILSSWPLLDESIGDHSVDRYTADIDQAYGTSETFSMCRLASAIYLTDIDDVIDRSAAMGFKTIDMIEAPGFRCAVLDSTT